MNKPNLQPGIVSGADYVALVDWAKHVGYALPAVNVASSSTANAVLEAAAKTNSDVIIQISAGAAKFWGGAGIGEELQAQVDGAVSLARHIQTVSKRVGVGVILHTDHANRKLLPWVDGLIAASEEEFKNTGKPLYSSHMIDLSEEPIEDNIAACKERIGKLNAMGMSLEIELGITGGEEDGVGKDVDEIDNEHLYTQPDHVLTAHNELTPLGHISIAAAFGNVHGVYKPGNVKLRPEILRDAQALGAEKLNLGDKPFSFVFHGGSGSEDKDIKDAISYGVFKINIDTDTQFAYSNGVGKHTEETPRAFMYQIDPDTDAPYKKFYDPKGWMRKAETSMVNRLIVSFELFGAANNSLVS